MHDGDSMKTRRGGEARSSVRAVSERAAVCQGSKGEKGVKKREEKKGEQKKKKKKKENKWKICSAPSSWMDGVTAPCVG